MTRHVLGHPRTCVILPLDVLGRGAFSQHFLGIPPCGQNSACQQQLRDIWKHCTQCCLPSLLWLGGGVPDN